MGRRAVTVLWVITGTVDSGPADGVRRSILAGGSAAYRARRITDRPG